MKYIEQTFSWEANSPSATPSFI